MVMKTTIRDEGLVGTKWLWGQSMVKKIIVATVVNENECGDDK